MAKAKKTEESKEMVENPILAMLSGYSEEELIELSSTTGLEELPEERRRHPLIAWNIDTRDTDGTRIVPNLFLNCQTNEQLEEINCALIFIREDFEYRKYESGENTLICRSYDKITGTRYTEDEKQYKCSTCPYRKAPRGKKRPCSTVARIAAYDLNTKTPFLLFVKSTSYIPFFDYIEKTFFGKLEIGKRKVDLPLYMVKTKLRLTEQSHGGDISYFLNPEADGYVDDKETVMALKEISESFRKMGASEMTDVEEEPQEDAPEGFINQDEEYEQGEEERYENTPPPINDDDVPF